VLSVSSLKLLT